MTRLILLVTLLSVTMVYGQSNPIIHQQGTQSVFGIKYFTNSNLRVNQQTTEPAAAVSYQQMTNYVGGATPGGSVATNDAAYLAAITAAVNSASITWTRDGRSVTGLVDWATNPSNTLFAGKSDTNHNHDSSYYPLSANPSNYVTQSVTNGLLSAESDTLNSVTARGAWSTNDIYIGVAAGSVSRGLWFESSTTNQLNATTGSLEWNGSTVWTAANDGLGSGLDADMVDGLHAASFVTNRATVSGGTGIIVTTNGVDYTPAINPSVVVTSGSPASVLVAPGIDGQVMYNSNNVLAGTVVAITNLSPGMAQLTINRPLSPTNLSLTTPFVTAITNNNGAAVFHMTRNGGGGNNILFSQARGTPGAETAASNGDTPGFYSRFYNGTTYQNAAGFTMPAVDTQTTNNSGGSFVIWTVATNTTGGGTSTLSRRATVSSEGAFIVGTGTQSDYKLEVAGTAYIGGKLTATGGVDPPYVTYDAQTRGRVIRMILREVPDDKMNGAHLYFNAAANELEFARINLTTGTASVYRINGTLVASIALPDIGPKRMREFYTLDTDTGDIVTNRVLRTREWQVKDRYEFDGGEGKFYRLVRRVVDGEEEWVRGPEVTKAEAIERREP